MLNSIVRRDAQGVGLVPLRRPRPRSWPPGAARPRNLSPTRVPLIAADVALWHGWAAFAPELLAILNGTDSLALALRLNGGES